MRNLKSSTPTHTADSHTAYTHKGNNLIEGEGELRSLLPSDPVLSVFEGCLLLRIVLSELMSLSLSLLLLSLLPRLLLRLLLLSLLSLPLLIISHIRVRPKGLLIISILPILPIIILRP